MFKKIITLIICFMFLTSPVFAYNPDSFKDEELITVQGQRPLVDIFVTELQINIKADDFIDSIAKTETTIVNEGTVPCYLNLEIQNVPIDLKVNAEVDTNFLHKGEKTTLNISVELTDQQEIEDFTFTILVKATLRP